MSAFVPFYNLENMTPEQRQNYIKAVCKHINVPEELNLIVLGYIDSGDGPRQLVAYAKRGAAEIIRINKGINVIGLDQFHVGGSIVFKATGQDKTGHQEIAVGSKWIDGLSGKDLDDGIMTSQTRAIRRMTLQFTGTGILDESEVTSREPIQTTETKMADAVVSLPVVEPNNQPGNVDTGQKIFKDAQAKLRQDAIESLNTEEVLVPKKRKPRGPRKPKIDMGPSESVLIQQPSSPVPVPLPPIPQPPLPLPPPPAAVSAPIQVNNVAPVQVNPAKLTSEQIKPFRQRLFKIVNDELEPNGFLPKEGMGNQDKLRELAKIMFPDVTNMTQLTLEQWEKYVSNLENKLSTIGPQQTIKFIEETIGI